MKGRREGGTRKVGENEGGRKDGPRKEGRERKKSWTPQFLRRGSAPVANYSCMLILCIITNVTTVQTPNKQCVATNMMATCNK